MSPESDPENLPQAFSRAGGKALRAYLVMASRSKAGTGLVSEA